MRDINARELFKSCDRVKAVETGPEKGIVLYNHEPQMRAYKLAIDRALSHNGKRNLL